MVVEIGATPLWLTALGGENFPSSTNPASTDPASTNPASTNPASDESEIMNEQHPTHPDVRDDHADDHADHHVVRDDRDTIECHDEGDAPLLIDCGTCVARETDACSDCLVTFLCDVEPQAEAVVFDLDEIRAVRLLAKAGMVPTLRHRASS